MKVFAGLCVVSLFASAYGIPGPKHAPCGPEEPQDDSGGGFQTSNFDPPVYENCIDRPVAVCVALDMSGSVCTPSDWQSAQGCENCPSSCHEANDFNKDVCCANFDYTMKFAKDLAGDVEAALSEVEFSLVTFATEAHTKTSLVDKTEFLEFVNNLDYSGGLTHTGGAIERCYQTLQSYQNEKVIVLVTDGTPTVGAPGVGYGEHDEHKDYARGKADIAKNNGVAIIPILIQTVSEDNEFLSELGSDPSLTTVTTFDGLDEQLEDIANKVKCAGKAPPLGPTPAPTAAPTMAPTEVIHYIGCYPATSADGSTFDESSAPDIFMGDGLTQEECEEKCISFDYIIRQGNGECWCGREFEEGYKKHGSANDCTCDAANQGGWRNCVYDTSPAMNYIGCYKDGSDRALPHRKGNSDAATCRKNCADAGFPFMGRQYNNECWCGYGSYHSYFIMDEVDNCPCGDDSDSGAVDAPDGASCVFYNNKPLPPEPVTEPVIVFGPEPEPDNEYVGDGNCLDLTVNVCVAIDMSGSVCTPQGEAQACYDCDDVCWEKDVWNKHICCNNFALSMDFAKDLARKVDSTTADSRFSLVSFASSASKKTDLGSKNNFVSKVNQLDYEGGVTNTGDAIYRCYETLRNAPDERVIVLLTDGTPTYGKSGVPDGEKEEHRQYAKEKANHAKNNNMEILPVLVNTVSANFDFLKELASDPNSVTEVTKFEELHDELDNIASRVRCAGQAPPTPAPTKTPQPTEPPTPSPTFAPTVATEFLGCYPAAAVDQTDFSEGSTPYEFMGYGYSFEQCYELCSDTDYMIRQGDGECWCGANTTPGYQKYGSANDCNCDIGATQHGGHRNCVYDTTDSTTFRGCWKDGNPRAMPRRRNNGSLEYCHQQCKDEGYPFFGRQYTNECWCGEGPSSPLLEKDEIEGCGCGADTANGVDAPAGAGCAFSVNRG